MAQLEVTFYDGSGKTYIDPNAGEEDGTATVTADCNCGDDRTVNVRIASDKGGLSKQVTINQVGVREQFIPADQTEGMKGADGDYFLGIKAEYADNLPDGCIPPPLNTSI